MTTTGPRRILIERNRNAVGLREREGRRRPLTEKMGSELFRNAGITWTQYNALRILRGARGEALSCGEIGERMITRDSDVTPLLDRLEKQSLVQRAREENDRRMVKTRITEQGLALLEQLDEPVAHLHQRQLDHLGEAKLRQLLSLLEEASSP